MIDSISTAPRGNQNQRDGPESGRTGGGGEDMRDLQQYVDSRMAQLSARLPADEENSDKNASKFGSVMREVDGLKANNAQLVSLITTLQSHVADEHIHRINGQQELREVVSAEITARRKAQNKTSSTIERALSRQDEDISMLKKDTSLLAENLNARISTIETNVSTAVTSVFQEIRDVREYTRSIILKIREDIATINTASIGGSGNAMANDIQTALIEKVEELHEQTNGRFDQITKQSRSAWVSLNDRTSGIEQITNQSRNTFMSITDQIASLEQKANISRSAWSGLNDQVVELESRTHHSQNTWYSLQERVTKIESNPVSELQERINKLEKGSVAQVQEVDEVGEDVFDLESDEAHSAATKLQAIQRRKLAKQIYSELKEKKEEDRIAEEIGDSEEVHSAASKLQAVQRSKKAKQEVAELKDKNEQERIAKEIGDSDEAHTAATKLQGAEKEVELSVGKKQEILATDNSEAVVEEGSQSESVKPTEEDIIVEDTSNESNKEIAPQEVTPVDNESKESAAEVTSGDETKDAVDEEKKIVDKTELEQEINELKEGETEANVLPSDEISAE